MRVHLVDGTYELFRHFYGLPAEVAASSRGAAARGVAWSLLDLIAEGATHVGMATDQVIESFRNDLWPTYKTGIGVDPALMAQFPVLEELVAAMGIVVWPMLELEADDALATAAARAAADPAVEQVVICTPDKDLAQCVRGDRVVQLDRRQGILRDEAGVRARFGVGPASIPDYLALVGDSADGFPGLPGWGAKSAAAVLAAHHSIDEVPADPERWGVRPRGAARLAASLAEGRRLAELFRDLATLRTEAPGVLEDGAESLRWRGPRPEFANMARELGAADLAERAERLAPEKDPKAP